MVNNKCKTYLNKYVFPLIGIPYKDIASIKFNSNFDFDGYSIPSKNYSILNNEVKMFVPRFSKQAKQKPFLKFTLPDYLDDESKTLLDKCLASFYKHCFTKNISSLSEKGEETLFRYCIDSSICAWVSGQSEKTSNELEKLLLCLENWSIKTYEGHKVSFSFLFNPQPTEFKENKYKEKIGNFSDFIDSDYGAVFTDGITSIIELDCNCEFIKYHSITEGNIIDNCSLTNNIPYRFTHVISKYVEKEKIGIFLLINGDIIIAKNREIFFVKRNNRWLNFRNKLFKTILNEKHIDIASELIESIFITALDVSFAHNGGIIAVVDDAGIKWKEDVLEHIENNDNQSMIHELDLFNDLSLFDDNNLALLFDKILREEIDAEQTDEYEQKRKNRNIRKRITKRKYIYKMISQYSKLEKTVYFNQLDRRFKVEAVGLDGACILNKKGEVLSFGAIIKNDAGSSEGGRGAAAKKLSNYGGFAIKISTDGYVEVFIDDVNVFAIK